MYIVVQKKLVRELTPNWLDPVIVLTSFGIQERSRADLPGTPKIRHVLAGAIL